MNQEFRNAIKSMVFAQSFVEVLDDFKGSNGFKHQLKNKGLSFAKEMDKYLNTVYEKGQADSTLYAIIERCQQAIDEVIDNEITVKQ